ncbi:conserved hypothetical protein [Aeromonas salmonicida]|nr:conserved hypothetical protein [Aeromonas salmonicida]
MGIQQQFHVMTSINTDRAGISHGNRGRGSARQWRYSEALMKQVKTEFDRKKRKVTSGVVHDGQ